MWRVPTGEEAHCLLFPLSVSALLLLWASSTGQRSASRPLRLPQSEGQISGWTILQVVSPLMQWDEELCCVRLLHIRALTSSHPSVSWRENKQEKQRRIPFLSCLQRAPRRISRAGCSIVLFNRNLCRGRWPEALGFLRIWTEAYRFLPTPPQPPSLCFFPSSLRWCGQ